MVEEAAFEENAFEEKMFADSMLETSWSQRTHRKWTTLISFGVQVLAIVCLLLLPLWRTVGLPAVARVVSTPVSMGSPGAPHPSPSPRPHVGSTTQPALWHPLMPPAQMPIVIGRGDDEPSPEPPGVGVGPGLSPGAGNGPAIPNFGGNNVVAPVRPTGVVPTFRTSSMMEGSLIRRVQPIYPPLAKSARIQGSVILAAVIGKAGNDREPAGGIGPSDAGASGNRRRQPMALPPVHPE
ncbi:MAG TPA: hypothetical protein VGM18_14755 [Candidatus Sulfotelmatobacter sp.]